MSTLLVACEKKAAESPSASPAATAATAATGAARELRRAQPGAEATADQKPEPEEQPCKFCTVDSFRKITGAWQAATCYPAKAGPVVYPAGLAVVEVVSGTQKGSSFAVTAEPGSFVMGAALSGTLSAEAEPAGWTEAKLWVTDANGAKCSSALALHL